MNDTRRPDRRGPEAKTKLTKFGQQRTLADASQGIEELSWDIVDRLDALHAGVPESELHPLDDVSRSNVARLQDRSIWIEVKLSNQWIAAYRIVVQDGIPVVGELRIFPASGDDDLDDVGHRRAGEWKARYLGIRAEAPRGGISASLVHSVRVGEHRKAADVILRKMRLLRGEAWKDDYGLAAMVAPTRSRRGRKGLGDLFYAKLARDYAAACGSEDAARPAAAIAKQLPKAYRGRVRDLLFKARRRGLLTTPRQGLPGGELTPKALEILARENVPANVPAPASTRPKTTQRHSRARRKTPR